MKDISYIFLLLALIAEIVGTIGGFGSSVFFVPVANIYFDFYSVLGLTAVFHVFSNLSKIALFKNGLNKQLLVQIGVPSVVFVVIGGLLSNYFQTNLLEVILGVFLVIFSAYFLFNKNKVIQPNKKNAVIGGGLSGFTAGLLGTGGAIRGLTMSAFNLEKSVFIATSAFIDFMIDFTRTFVYWNNGYIQTKHLIYVPFLVVIGFVGTYIGKRLLQFVPQSRFKKISLGLVLVIGVITLIRVFVVRIPS